MSRRFGSIKLLVTALSPFLVLGQAFCNSLSLTAAGTTDGFTLSTFATTNPGNTGCCGGPFGIAVASTGNIIVGTGGGSQYVFADINGQTTGSALFTTTSSAGTAAYATAGGQAYGAQGGHFVAFKSDGTVDHVLTGVAATPYLGMWGDPVNGHIIATSYSGFIDINPLGNGGLGSFRTINGSLFGDGVSVSADGQTAYVERFDQIIGYNITTGAQTFDSGFFAGLSNPDGSGVISSTNSLNGDIIVNFNGNSINTGGIGLLDPSTSAFSVIASGGTRGDYVSPDTNNGTLFLDYGDTVERLSCGPNCSIGGPPPPPSPSPVPEPGTFALLGTGLTWLGAMARRQLMKA